MIVQRSAWRESPLRVRFLHPFKVRQCGGGGGRAELEDTPHDSAESSVEGIFLFGVRPLHPFKVRQCGGGAELEDTPHDSAESSVEGIFLSGVCSLHPFKMRTVQYI
jgi:hypothetical protein